MIETLSSWISADDKALERESKLLSLRICSIGGEEFFATQRMWRRQRREKGVCREGENDPGVMAEGHEKPLVVGGWKDSKILLWAVCEAVPDETASFNSQFSHEIYHSHNAPIGLLVFLTLEELRSELSGRKNEPGIKGEHRIPHPTPLPW